MLTRMNRRQILIGASACLLGVRTVGAQDNNWPSRPVHFLVPSAAGGAADTIVRLLADELSKTWPKRALVENRPGGAGVVGTLAGARAEPDGYTLVVSTSGTNGINPSVMRNLPYDAERDFIYVTLIFAAPPIIVAHPSFAPSDVPALIAAAKAASDPLLYGSGGPGTSHHMAAELFKLRTGIAMTHIPYRGSGPAMADLLAGSIPLMFDSVASSLPHIQAGRIKPIAVTSLQRQPQLPAVPTVADTLPGFEAIGWAGIAVPRGTPQTIVNRVNTDVTALLRDPAFAERVLTLGGSPMPQSVDEANAFVRSEIAKWGEVARAGNIRLDG